MEATAKMLVSLDGSVDEEILLKKAQGTYMGKKVVSLLDYMLNPDSDDLNPGYNDRERRVADVIKAWRRKAQTNPKDIFALAAKLIDGSDVIELNLEDLLSAYESRILQSRPAPGGDSSITMPYIELFASYKEGGQVIQPKMKLE